MIFFQVLLNSLVLVTQVLLLAAGLYLIHTVSRIIHVGLAGIMVVGAYSFYALNQLEIPVWLSFGGSVCVAALMGKATFLLLRDFAQKKQPLLGLLMSMAIWIAVESLLAILFGSEGKFLIEGVLPTYNFAGLSITQVGFWSLVIGAVTVLVALFVLYFMPVGRVLRAVKQHAECAVVIGIRERVVQSRVFMVAAGIAGMMGILTGMNTALTPSSGSNLTLIAFIALLVGGVHDFRGTILASFILVTLPEFMTSLQIGPVSISGSWKLVVMFTLALILLLIRPQGLLVSSPRKY